MFSQMLQRLAYRAGIATLMLYFAFAAAIVLVLPPVDWVDLFYDDAYYYMGIARNIIDHGFSGFSYPFETNGYQPLWLFCHVVMGRILGTEYLPSINMGLTAFFLVYFCIQARKLGLAFPALISVFVFFMIFDGMESASIPLFAVGFMYSRSWTAKGFLGALLFLSRLDTLALVVASDIVSSRRGKTDLRHWFVILPFAALYFIGNYLYYGVPVPVSGLSKSVGIAYFSNYLAALEYLKLWAVFPAFAVFFLALDFFGIRRMACKAQTQASMLTLLMVAFYYFAFSGWPVWPWYLWPNFLIAFFVIAEFFRVDSGWRFSGFWRSASTWTVGISSALVIAYYLHASATYIGSKVGSAVLAHEAHDSYGRRNLEMIEGLGLMGIHGGFFAMGDRAGSFGYFCGDACRFFHTEGLVADASYLRAMRHDQGYQYFHDVKPDYIVADRERFFEDGDVIGIAEPVQGVAVVSGPYMNCFNRKSLVYAAIFDKQKRYVFKVSDAVGCPDRIVRDFEAVKRKSNGLHYQALPDEYQHGAYALTRRLFM